MSSSLPGGISVQRFRFLSRSYDAAAGELNLAYSFDEGEAFVERIRFPFQPWPSDPSRQAAFTRALDLLHLVAGVSYYKACVPESMAVSLLVSVSAAPSWTLGATGSNGRYGPFPLLIRDCMALKSSVELLRGNGVSGTGFPRKRHKGSQPSPR